MTSQIGAKDKAEVTRILRADILEGDMLVIDLSDGTTLQVTLKQLLSDDAGRKLTGPTE